MKPDRDVQFSREFAIQHLICRCPQMLLIFFVISQAKEVPIIKFCCLNKNDAFWAFSSNYKPVYSDPPCLKNSLKKYCLMMQQYLFSSSFSVISNQIPRLFHVIYLGLIVFYSIYSLNPFNYSFNTTYG